MEAEILIVDYGVGNLASLKNAFRAIGVHAVLGSDPQDIENAAKLVLPGVGAFTPAMQKLRDSHLLEPLLKKSKSGTPLLGICLGMQLLFSKSFERGTCEGLDLIPGEVRRFEGVPKVPHMGWNDLKIVRPSPLFKEIPDGTFVYFVHSFYCVPDHPDTVLAVSEYGGAFCAAVRSGNIWGVQFHPEKSHRMGLRILKNFAYEIGEE